MKIYKTLLVLAAIAAVASCDRNDKSGTTRTTGATSPDNTRVNERDRGDTTTPLAQGNNPADLDTTQAIRKAVMDDDTLSSDAKNVKIITNGGVIALRGPVKSEAEHRAIVAKAAAAAGNN